MQAYLETETDKTESLQRFIQKVKQVTELKALTPELIHEFVDKIVVYAPRYLDGKRVQLLDIYYSGVGILHELTPEEMEAACRPGGTVLCGLQDREPLPPLEELLDKQAVICDEVGCGVVPMERSERTAGRRWDGCAAPWPKRPTRSTASSAAWPSKSNRSFITWNCFSSGTA